MTQPAAMTLAVRRASLASDVRSGLRQLRAAPVSSAVLIVALGLGIGSTIAVFTEIGLRLALGATGASVVRLVVRQGLTLTVVGLAIGLVAARLISGVLRTSLFAVTPTDVATYVGGTIALLVVAVAAMTIPAVRAARIDPARTLSA